MKHIIRPHGQTGVIVSEVHHVVGMGNYVLDLVRRDGYEQWHISTRREPIRLYQTTALSVGLIKVDMVDRGTADEIWNRRARSPVGEFPSYVDVARFSRKKGVDVGCVKGLLSRNNQRGLVRISPQASCWSDLFPEVEIRRAQNGG